MADLVTRLLLNNSLFDNSIRQSTQQVQSFQQMGRNVSATITKFAGVLGVAVSASELFNAAINSNSIALNKWNDTIGTAKESIDTFFTSLTTGDWSIFENGILNAIRLSKQYTLALRELKSNLKIGDVHLSLDEKELNRYENIATDESNSKADREKAFADFKKKSKETVEYINGLSKSTNDNLSSMLEGKGIKADKNIRDMIFNYLDTSTSGGKDLKKYSEKVEELNATNKMLKNAYSMEGGAGIQLAKQLEEDRKTLEASVMRMKKLNPELAEAYKLKINFNEEEVDELLDYTDKIIGLEDRLESAKKQVTDLSKDFDKNGLLIQKGTKITSVAKEKSQAITTGDYFSTPMIIPPTTLADLEAEKKGIIDRMNHSNQQDYIKLKVKLEKKEQEIEDFKNGKGGMLIKGLDVSKAIPLEFKDTDIIDDSKVNNTYNYADGLNAIASAMGNISAMTNEGATAWLNWGATLLGSIATAIPAITALTAAKYAEANANTAAAASGAASSQAGIPFVGPILAVAAVASVLAAIMSAPKFATGGIVRGNSTIGDFNLARVNSGEMILNNHQQRNLFNLLNNSGAGNTINSSKVEFKIEGKLLVGVLNNYNHKVSKVR